MRWVPDDNWATEKCRPWPSDNNMKRSTSVAESLDSAPVQRRDPKLVHPCPCGRGRELHECCLPLAAQLRDGPREGPFGGRRPGSPVGELRASTALLLWGLLSHRSGDERLRSAHSLAARVFWGTVLHANPIWAAGGAVDGGYGRELFERLWGRVDPDTRTWLLGTLPPAFRADSAV